MVSKDITVPSGEVLLFVKVCHVILRSVKGVNSSFPIEVYTDLNVLNLFNVLLVY